MFLKQVREMGKECKLREFKKTIGTTTTALTGVHELQQHQGDIEIEIGQQNRDRSFFAPTRVPPFFLTNLRC